MVMRIQAESLLLKLIILKYYLFVGQILAENLDDFIVCLSTGYQHAWFGSKMLKVKYVLVNLK